MAQKGDKPPFSFWSSQNGDHRQHGAWTALEARHSRDTPLACSMLGAPAGPGPVLTGSKGHKGNR